MAHRRWVSLLALLIRLSGHSNAHAARKAFIAAGDEAELIMRLALPTDARRYAYVRAETKALRSVFECSTLGR